MTEEYASVLWCVPQADSLRVALTSEPALRVRECLDAVDLAAAAMIEPHSVALVSAESPRMNADLVMRVESLGTRFIAVGVHPPGSAERQAERAVTRSWGISSIAEVQDGGALVSELTRTSPEPDAPRVSVPQPRGQVTVVWGPHGSPGRSVVARGLAEAWSRSGYRTGLLDLDPSATQAIALGITNGDTGLLRAIHAIQRRSLTPASLAHMCRSLGPHLSVLTGLDGDENVHDLTPEALGELVRVSREVFERVVIDVDSTHTDGALLASLEPSVHVVVVVRNTVVGLARAVREVPSLVNVLADQPFDVVVNGTSSPHAARQVLEPVVNARGSSVRHWHALTHDSRVARAEEMGKLLSEIPGRSRARKEFARMAKAYTSARA